MPPTKTETETETEPAEKKKPAGRKAKAAAKRQDALPDPADVFPERSHKEGCPTPADRLEVFVGDRPRRVDGNGDLIERARKVVVARCVECGEDRVVPDSELDDDLVASLTPS